MGPRKREIVVVGGPDTSESSSTSSDDSSTIDSSIHRENRSFSNRLDEETDRLYQELSKDIMGSLSDAEDEEEQQGTRASRRTATQSGAAVSATRRVETTTRVETRLSAEATPTSPSTRRKSTPLDIRHKAPPPVKSTPFPSRRSLMPRRTASPAPRRRRSPTPPPTPAGRSSRRSPVAARRSPAAAHRSPTPGPSRRSIIRPATPPPARASPVKSTSPSKKATPRGRPRKSTVPKRLTNRATPATGGSSSRARGRPVPDDDDGDSSDDNNYQPRPNLSARERDLRDARSFTQPPKRFFSRVRDLQGIRRLQQSTAFLMHRLPFSRAVRQVLVELGYPDFKMQKIALYALQSASEEFTVSFLEACGFAAQHAKRVTIMPRDSDFVKRMAAYDFQVIARRR